jgi:hypothetical protein
MSHCTKQNGKFKLNTILCTVLFMAILLATPRAIYSQCTDSSTRSDINLYLLKGAEAREQLNLCRQFRAVDSSIIATQRRAIQTQSDDLGHVKRVNRSLRVACVVLAVLFLIAL